MDPKSVVVKMNNVMFCFTLEVSKPRKEGWTDG